MSQALVQELVDAKLCVSFSEARRLVTSWPEERIREKLNFATITQLPNEFTFWKRFGSLTREFGRRPKPVRKQVWPEDL